MEYKYVGINDNENCEKLDILLAKFSNDIDLNTFLIKEKIKNKLEIIKHLRTFGFSMLNYDKETGKSIINKLNKLNENNNVVIYNDNLNKILGSIIHNIYEHSGYQVLISNVPEYSMQTNGQNYEKISSDVIYDTIMYYGGNCKVLNVFQSSRSSYLIMFENNNDAKYISDLLNNNLIDKNVIKVDYFDNEVSDINKVNNSSNKSVRFASDIYNGINTNTNTTTTNTVGYSYMNWLKNKINSIVMYLLPSLIKNKK
jgi:hypothetical protein